MTNGFQHQDQAAAFALPKSAATPQHGQKNDDAVKTAKQQSRSFQPRPGH